jgi:hypothetical protein
MIETGIVTDRRPVRYVELGDIRADAERMAQVERLRTTGNWAPAQILQHVADGIHHSIDGYGMQGPEEIRRSPMMRRDEILTDGIPVGFHLPTNMQHFMPSPNVTLDEAVAALGEAIARTVCERMRADHPFLGSLSHEQYVLFHCRHAELHFSFVHFDERQSAGGLGRLLES